LRSRILALFGVELFLLFGGHLLGALLRLDAFGLDSLGIDDMLLLGGVFRRDTIAVVGHPHRPPTCTSCGRSARGGAGRKRQASGQSCYTEYPFFKMLQHRFTTL
jgi:hypothetical protein